MQQYPVIVLMVSLCVVWANAHAKPSIDLPRAGDPATPGQQLQQAVNDPANAGVQIRLAAGTYVLDPAGQNGGRLFLQPDMDLIGSNDYLDCDDDGTWDPLAACLGGALDPDQFAVDGSETLIDGTAISGPGGAAVMRAGRDNRITRVTIRAPRIRTVAGSLDLNLIPSSGGISAVVTDSILEGGQRGIRCNNGAPAMSGISSFASIERNIVRDNKPVPGGLFGFGVQVQNSGATASSWTVHLRGNRISASRFGLFIVSNNAQMAETRVLSSGNLIYDNELGGFILPAFAPLGAAPGDSSNGNSMRFDSIGDAFVDNVTPDNPDPFLGLGGGLMAFAAGRDSPTSGTHSGNQLELQLLGSRFTGNIGITGPRHLTLIGSFASAISGPETGTNNVLRVLMRNTISDEESGAFVVADSVPGDPTSSNRLIVIGSDVAFERTNPGVEVPAEGFFPPWEQ